MTTVSILGKGNMGGAIATILGRAGVTPQVIDQAQPDTAVTGDFVILAVPYSALDDIVATRGHELAGKVVVDVTNPVNFETFDSLVVPPDSSAAAELAAALPGSTVLKAFNTNFAGTIANGSLGDLSTTVLIAGDDADAKRTLADLVTAGGLTALDAGPLSRARELESIGFLQITLAAAEKVSWVGGFGVVA